VLLYWEEMSYKRYELGCVEYTAPIGKSSFPRLGFNEWRATPKHWPSE